MDQSQSSNGLHKGEACLVCRRKKMRCDAVKPSCGPCARAGRGHECEYEHTRFLTQISDLENQLATQQQRINELECLLHSQIDEAHVPTSSEVAVPSAAIVPAPSAFSLLTPEPALRHPSLCLPYELSQEQITQLATLFLPHAVQFGLPPSSTSSLPIALRARDCPLSEAIFACASFFAPIGSPWAGYHTLFFDRADRLVSPSEIDDFLKVQAYCLLATLAFLQAYSGNMTWLSRGHKNAAAAVHLACKQNWHRGTSSPVEYDTWWMVYAVDRTWGPVHGVSSAPRDAQITTSLPGPEGTLSMLCEGQTYGIHDVGETPESLKVKTLALRGRASDIIRSYSPHRHIPQTYWSNFYATIITLTRLDCVHKSAGSHSIWIASGRIIIHSTLLALHALINDREPALDDVTQITRILIVSDLESFQTLDPVVGICLREVEQFLEKDHQIYDVDHRVESAMSSIKVSLENLRKVYINVDGEDVKL